MKSIDFEEINGNNYTVMMDALALPGKLCKMTPVYESGLLAFASVLLYSEVSFFYTGNQDMSLIEAITNTNIETNDNADYIFSDTINSALVKESKKGNHINPDDSAILFFTCKDFNQTKVVLKGPGIDKEKEIYLPCDKEFIDVFMLKNSEYPLGVEVYFINEKNEILALSRTTKVEVI